MLSHFDTVSRLIEEKLVAVVRLDSGEQLVRVAEALKAGGMSIIEFTVSTPGAIDMIKEASARFGDQVLMGAGTVLDPETARAAMLAGAEFFVTPSLKLSTIEMVGRYSKVMMPGALTPTEVLTAWEAGADIVKVFPCGNVGGPKYIRALRAPFAHIEMIPTGGVNLETAGEFLKAGACAVAVGAELVDSKSVAERRFDVIEERARQYLAVIAKAREEMKAVA